MTTDRPQGLSAESFGFWLVGKENSRPGTSKASRIAAASQYVAAASRQKRMEAIVLSQSSADGTLTRNEADTYRDQLIERSRNIAAKAYGISPWILPILKPVLWWAIKRAAMRLIDMLLSSVPDDRYYACRFISSDG